MLAKAPDREKTGLLLSIAYPRILALRFKRQHVVEMLLRVSMCVQVSMRVSTYAGMEYECMYACR